MKRFVLVVLTLALVAGSLLAAGTPEPPQAPAQPAARTVGGLALPLSPTLASLRIACGDNWYLPKSFTLGLPVFAEIQKQTNVQIKWEVTPQAQWNDVVNTLFAAGQDMPDLIAGSFNAVQYYTAGLVLNLKPLIDQYAPNIKRQLETRKTVAAMVTMPTGEIPTLTAVFDETAMQDVWLVRQDWLDKVKLPVPKTIAEVETVLRAFRDKDPNGNGKADEIPIAFRDVWGPFYVVPNSFGAHAMNDFYWDANGKAIYVPTTPEYRDYVAWMAKLFGEKLLDQDFVTGNTEQYFAKVANNLVGMTTNNVKYAQDWNTANAGQNWVAFMLPDGPGGRKAFTESAQPVSGNFVITKDCKNPELAIKWIDYYWGSDEGMRYTNWGIEGLSYTMVGGKPKFTAFVDANPDKLSRADALRSIGALGVCYIVDPNGIDASAMTEPVRKLKAQYTAVMTQLYNHYDLKRTPAEDEVFNKYFNDINTYQNERLFNFITNKEPLSGFDAYVQKMYDMGLQKVLDVEQVVMNRFLQKK